MQILQSLPPCGSCPPASVNACKGVTVITPQPPVHTLLRNITMRSRPRSPRLASSGSTATATRSQPMLSAARSRSAHMPSGSNSGRKAVSSVGMSACSVGERRSTHLGTTSRRWSASQALCATARLSSTGCCRHSEARALEAGRRPERRPPDGRYSQRRTDRWPACCGGRLRRGPWRGRPFVAHHPQYPRAAPGARAAGDNHDA